MSSRMKRSFCFPDRYVSCKHIVAVACWVSPSKGGKNENIGFPFLSDFCALMNPLVSRSDRWSTQQTNEIIWKNIVFGRFVFSTQLLLSLLLFLTGTSPRLTFCTAMPFRERCEDRTRYSDSHRAFRGLDESSQYNLIARLFVSSRTRRIENEDTRFCAISGAFRRDCFMS